MAANKTSAIVETIDTYGRRTHRGVALVTMNGDTSTAKFAGTPKVTIGDRTATTTMFAGGVFNQSHRVTGITQDGGITTLTLRSMS